MEGQGSPEITIEEFGRVDLRVGLVKEASRISGSRKLIKLVVDLGELGTRTLVAGLGEWYEPEHFVNKHVIVVANLKPRKIFGIESQGMILATDTEVPVILTVEREVRPGARVR
ncbi:MAG: methionine--tRNA ligase subunit beta [Desulfurococcaceae archaeon]